MSLSDKDITAKNFQEFYNRIKPFLNQTAPSGFTPIGTVISVMGKKAPENYLVCDGKAYNILEYPELAVYIKDQFGSYDFFGGDGTSTFAVPDLRGEFLRGTGTNSHENQGSGANVGEHQDGTEQAFLAGNSSKLLRVFSDSSTFPSNFSDKSDSSIDVSSGTTKYFDSSAFGNAQTAQTNKSYRYTSRPTNTSVLYCIAYKNIFIDVKQVYSLNERVIGTWIDGKPIYQKTFILPDGIVADTWTTGGLSWSEIEALHINNLISVNANSSLLNNFPVSFGGEESHMFYVRGWTLQPNSCVTFQYTKTTD